ncbi:DinB family protein [Paenibacillus sp. BR1-192]|uniref:DinB family protein n=1 Tax=Paenibacillus sp. BR1-192 TaxID=3032287 RepID=UPI00240D0878|nr:DinB family protein [Paenibacillus sp. BR1-192]WFB56819.1 DinB family protein [Paenibacillus sp. BR1-192]
MDLSQRKQWNENHKKLTGMILDPAKHQTAVDLFLQQHRLLHSSRMSHSPIATLEDELVKNLLEETFRQYPVTAPDTKNSIIWHVWHITRIEDMTMNVLVNNDIQVLHAGQWNKKLHIDYVHSGNEMTEAEIADLSSTIDIDSLLAYRMEVGRNTRDVISRLVPGDFKQKVEEGRIHELQVQHAVKKEASWLLEYWGNKTIAGLVLMPATRHIFLHLNKSIRLKQRMQKLKI